MNDPSTQHFLTWRRRRDGASLEALFDAAAPRLLRLALHLVGDAQAAEDLVQQTFLTAIEAPERFDAERAVEPWLAGILANRARRVHRERARRIDPERVERALAEVDPAALVADRELAAEVLEALDALDEPYREAAVLRFVHGLEPTQIAHALGRAPGTVRVQLHRAAERLRRAVPAGALPAGLVALDAEALLGRVRDAVLERAASTAALAGAGSLTVTGTGAVAVMTSVKTWAALAAATTLAAVAAIVGLDDDAAGGGAAAPDSDAGGAVTLTAPEERDTAPVGARTSLASDAGATAAAAAQAPETSGAGASLVVRVHDGGEPVVGREVRVRAGGTDADLAARWLTTDDGGRAVFDALEPCVARIDVAGTAPRWRSIDGRTDVVLDVDLAGGARVRGVVAEAGGAPLEGARVLALANGVPPMEVARSDADGTFEYAGAAPVLRLVAAREGYAARGPTTLLAGSAAPVEVELLLYPDAGSVSGRVWDDRGAPAAGARVQLAQWNETENVLEGGEIRLGLPPREVRADADGAFRFESVPPGTIRVGARAAGVAGDAVAVEVVAGREADVDLRLATGATVEGTLRELDGAPVVGAEVRAPSGVPFAPATALTDGGGRYALVGVAPGSQVTLTALRPEQATPALERRFSLNPGQALVLDLVLDAAPWVEGWLTDPDGAPLAGWTVAFETRDATSADRGPARTTDATGAFEVPAAPGVEGWLVALPPRRQNLPPVAERSGVRAGDVVTLAVERERFPNAAVALRVVDAAGRPLTDATVGYWVAPEGSGGVGDEVGVDAPDAAVFLDHLAPGELRLEVRAPGRGRRTLESVALLPGETVDLGAVTMLPGGAIELRWSPPVDPDDDPVVAAASDEHRLTEHAERVAGDRWRVGPLQPGRYSLQLRQADRVIEVIDDVVVVAGETLDLGVVR